jgi:hypothetical protein
MSPAERLAAARDAVPLQAPWGAYLSPAGGDADGLIWFETEAGLCRFLAEALWPALAGVEPAAEDRKALDALLNGPQTLQWENLERLNLLLEPVAQIHWWGSLQQLFEGGDPFAKDLREAWRDSAGRGPQDYSELSPAEQASFSAFLRTVFNP